jgi:hypothetical protein
VQNGLRKMNRSKGRTGEFNRYLERRFDELEERHPDIWKQTVEELEEMIFREVDGPRPEIKGIQAIVSAHKSKNSGK